MPRRRTQALLALVLGCATVALLSFLFWRSDAGGPPVLSTDRSAAPAAERVASDPGRTVEATPDLSEPPVVRVPPTLPELPEHAAPTAGAGVELVVHGNLLDTEGEPIRGARSPGVRLTDAQGCRWSTDASDAGSYALSGIAPGVHWIAAHADGYRDVEAQIEIPSAPGLVQKDLVLAKSVVLRVRVVTPDGRPLVQELQALGPGYPRGLVPVATHAPPGPSFTEAWSSPNAWIGIGSFVTRGPLVEGLPAGCTGVLVLEGDLPVHVSLVFHHAVLETKLVPAGAEEVVFELEPQRLLGSLSGLQVKFVDAETSAPLARVRCLVAGGATTSSGNASDAEGSLVLVDHAPGFFGLHASKEGYATVHRIIELAPGSPTDLGTIALEHELTIQGRTVDEHGRPVGVALSLSVLDESKGPVHFDHGTIHRSAIDGTFTIRGLGRAAYVLRTSNHVEGANPDSDDIPAYVSGHVRVDTSAGSVEGLELRLALPTHVALRMQGGAAGKLRFEIVDEQGWPLVSSQFRDSAPRSFQLPRGKYRVLVREAGGALVAERELVVGKDPVELVITR